jgi:hypothetical protein
MCFAGCDNLRVDHDGAIPKTELNGSGKLPRTKSSLVNGLWIEVTLEISFAKMREFWVFSISDLLIIDL